MDREEIALVLQQKMREDFYWCRCDDIGVLEAIADWHIAEVSKVVNIMAEYEATSGVNDGRIGGGCEI